MMVIHLAMQALSLASLLHATEIKKTSILNKRNKSYR